MLGVTFMFLMGKEKPASSEKGTGTNEENLVSSNENSEGLDLMAAVDMTTYEPVLDFSGISPNKKKTDLRIQPVVLINFEGEILEEYVDIETFVRISRPSDYDHFVYFKDNNSPYFYYRSYQLSSEENSITLVKLPYDPASFQDLENGYFKDKEGVYYFDRSVFVRSQGGPLSESSKKPSFAFKKLEGIDIDTARTLARDTSPEVRKINSALIYADFLTDNESVYFKASKIAPNRDFAFITWQERDNVFLTNYFRTDNRVFCQNKEGKIEELPADAKLFTPQLIHKETFYAGDSEHFYIDCHVLKDDAGRVVDPGRVSFKSLYSNEERPTPLGLFIVSGNDLYFAQGKLFVSGVKNVNSLKLIGSARTRGGGSYDYVALDGAIYRIRSIIMYIYNVLPQKAVEQQEAGNLVNVMKSQDPVDIGTFETLSATVTKDKNRVYYLSYDEGFFGTFVPKDIASFESVPCSVSGDYYVDKYNVYTVRGSEKEGLEASIIEDLRPGDLGDYTFSFEAYEELCGGGMR